MDKFMTGFMINKQVKSVEKYRRSDDTEDCNIGVVIGYAEDIGNR